MTRLTGQRLGGTSGALDGLEYTGFALEESPAAEFEGNPGIMFERFLISATRFKTASERPVVIFVTLRSAYLMVRPRLIPLWLIYLRPRGRLDGRLVRSTFTPSFTNPF